MIVKNCNLEFNIVISTLLIVIKNRNFLNSIMWSETAI